MNGKSDGLIPAVPYPFCALVQNTEEQFAAWHKAAKARKKDCDREVLSLDEFKAWLKDS